MTVKASNKVTTPTPIIIAGKSVIPRNSKQCPTINVKNNPVKSIPQIKKVISQASFKAVNTSFFHATCLSLIHF